VQYRNGNWYGATLGKQQAYGYEVLWDTGQSTDNVKEKYIRAATPRKTQLKATLTNHRSSEAGVDDSTDNSGIDSTAESPKPETRRRKSLLGWAMGKSSAV
jgi:hypothetical protein